MKVKDGQTLCDDANNRYTGTISDFSTINGKTLTPVRSVAYIDGDGATQQVYDYTVLTGSNDDTTLPAGWYVVSGSDVNHSGILRSESGDLHIILADGAKLTVGNGLTSTGNLTIYGQSASGYSTYCCGGFVGWRNNTINVTNCLLTANLSTIGASDSYTFVHRGDDTDVKITNSYYTQALGTEQGSPVPVPTFAPEGYATFYSSVLDVVVPEGMKARIVTGSADGGKLTYQDVADGDTEVKTRHGQPRLHHGRRQRRRLGEPAARQRRGHHDHGRREVL